MPEHTPVLLTELIAGLNIKPNKDYIDCTLGAGGQAREVLRLNSPRGKVYGIDLDEAALTVAKKNLREFGDRLVCIHRNYRSLEEVIGELKIVSENLGGIYADLGLSSLQLASGRGFSFQGDAFLSMSFDESGPLTAEEILNNWSEEEIGRILREDGEEKFWKLIANRIVSHRRNERITRTSQLVDIILQVKPKFSRDKIHPATKTFQALRIAVNDELNGLRDFLPVAVKNLPSRARLAVISFHSLEDRLVKQFFKQESIDCLCPPQLPQCVCGHRKSLKLITTKPIGPSREEIQVNPRARSAKLRIVEKI